jgi:hypothetical protein
MSESIFQYKSRHGNIFREIDIGELTGSEFYI